jgi:hypothetical protein
VGTKDDAPQVGQGTAARGGWLRSAAMIVVFDIAAPLVAYNLLRSAGMTAVSALILSGVFPALGVAIAAAATRRLDVVGVVVLAGIVVGTILGLVSHSARAVLVEGSVPTGVFGVGCLGSLWARRPLVLSFILEFTGPDNAKGREMTLLWQHDDRFRHDIRIVTVVWGAGLLVEAALRVVIVYNTSTGTALASSKVTPYLFAGVLSAWTLVYGARQRKKAERLAVAAKLAEPGPDGSAQLHHDL